MATVFKAYQPSIERYVAVKILPRQFAEDPNFVKRFAHEAKAIATLEHPHILPVHDFGTHEDLTYMVMRYVEGGTLSNLMSSPLSYERIVEIVGNVARALDYAHQRGVVHRDIKPSNILIDQRGEVLLTDFGIAKMVEGAGETQLTKPGGILGTPAYMSPEQAKGSNVDGRSDIYSLGVVLYELLTGRPPYQAETPLAIVLMHINDPLPPPRTVKPTVPEPLERVVLKAMAKDREQRYTTAAQMEQALKNALQEIKSGATTVGAVSDATQMHPPPKPTKPEKAKSGGGIGGMVIGGIAVALLLCVGLGAGLVMWGLSASSEDDQTPTAVAEAADPTPTDEDEEDEDATPTSAVETEPTPTGEAEAADTPPPPTTIEGAGELLFEDEFDSNRHGWPTGEETDEFGHATTALVDGRYRITKEATDAVILWRKPNFATFDNFVLSVDTFLTESNAAVAYGVVFRNNENGDLYSFEIDSGGYYLVDMRADDSWERLVEYTQSAAINAGGYNRLTVKAIGPHLTFYINGEEVTALEDDTVDTGAIGLALELYDQGNTATVEFDNLAIYAITPEELEAVVGDEPPTAEAEDGDGMRRMPGGDSGGLLLDETFDTNDNGWDVSSYEDEELGWSEQAKIDEGLFTLEVGAGEVARYAERGLPEHQFSDFLLSVETYPADGEAYYGYGVSFRENEHFEGYLFEIRNNGDYTIHMYKEGEFHLLEKGNSGLIASGGPNLIQIIAKGSSLTFLINDNLLTTVEDDTFSTGTIALAVEVYKADKWAGVSFDNLLIQAQ
jgi:hypothetical protein